MPMLAFGTERTLALIRTSIFGTVYAASPRTSVAHGSVTWQIRLLLVDAGDHQQSRAAPSTSAQVSCTPRPVLVPAWSVRPLRSRAFRLVVTPCQYCVRAGA